MLRPGRRTVATTWSPAFTSVTFGPTASTRPKPSWPMTRKSNPAGAAPYSAALISLSVPSTPTRKTLIKTPRPPGTSSAFGFGTSRRWNVFDLPGITATAFTNSRFVPIPLLCVSVIDCIALSSELSVEIVEAKLHSVAALFNELGNQARPSGLMTRTDTSAIVSMEVLVEIDQVAPVGIVLKDVQAAVYGTLAVV